MRAILLAAGLGTRLRPLTNHIPKCLVEIDGRPLLDYWLHGLFFSGIERVLINLHHHAGAVRDYLRGSCFRERIDLVYEAELLGTAGTLKQNFDFVKNDSFILAHADNFFICDFQELVKAHYTRPLTTEITMVIFDAPDPRQCGIIEADKNGIVQVFHEKVENPPGNRANAGVYLCEPSIAKFCKNIIKKNPDFSNDVIPQYLGRIFAWEKLIYNQDIGTPENYAAALNDSVGLRGKIEKLGWFKRNGSHKSQ